MSSIRAELKRLREVQKEMERIARELHGEPILNAVRRATLIVERGAKLKAPVDTGRLRASITPVVGASVKYAGYVETGLMVSGKAQPYLYPAFQENADKIAGILEDAVTKAELEEGTRYCEKCREKSEPAR